MDDESSDDGRPAPATGVRVAVDETDREDAFAVRRAVFVDEQGVPESLELDEHDADATHFVAYADGEAVGAARLRRVDEGTGKVERVAVREPRRGEGWGRRLMDALEAVASEEGYETLVLHAQVPVVEFYRNRGYRTVGEEFEEAGIPHVEMVRSLADG